MALQTTIPILMVVLSFALYMGMPDGNGNHTNYNSALGFITTSVSSMNSEFKTMLGGLVGVGVIAATFLVPNSFAIFGGMAALIVGFLTIPNNIAQASMMPKEIADFIFLIFALMYILALTSWFKGTPDY